MITRHEEDEEDQDSLFGSPPSSPRISALRAPSPALSLPFASIRDIERRLSTSTDTQNVGTIALPGSHPFSELPLNPLALSLNHTLVHRPPAQPQAQTVPTTLHQIQSWQPPPAPSKFSTAKGSKKSGSPLKNCSPPKSCSPPPSRDPEFSLPDPSAPPPVHFLRNQQNLLGKAGLVAGVKPSTITHIRGATPSNPIIIDDEDAPILGRPSQFRQSYVDPSLLTVPSNEDIVSVLISQKDIFPVLQGILSLIGKAPTQHTPTPPLSENGPDRHPPVKKRKLNRVPAGATDWDVPYPFPAGEGPNEYHKTWERERGKNLIAQLVKLIKIAARKAATKNYRRKEQARQAAWEKLQQEMRPQRMQSGPITQDITVSQDSSPSPDDSAFMNIMGKHFDFGAIMDESSFSTSNTAAVVPDDLDALVSSMLTSLSNVNQEVYHDSTGGGWNEVGQITGDSLFGMTKVEDMVGTTTMMGEGMGKGKEVPDFLLADAVPPSTPTQTQSAFDALIGTQLTDIAQLPLPSSEQQECPTSPPPPAPTPVPVPGSPAPHSKNTISQSRNEEILRRAREKRRQVQEELDQVKTQLWETTIEQAALMHLLKRCDNHENLAVRDD